MLHRRIHVQNSSRFTRTLTIEHKIDQILDKYESENEQNSFDFAALQHIYNSKGHCLKQLLWFFIITACFAICIYQTYDRIDYYLSEPSYVLIEMRKLKELKYPTFVFCTYYKGVAFNKLESLANTRKTEPCKLDILDTLVTGGTFSTTVKIWKKTSIKDDFEQTSMKTPFQVPIISEADVTGSYVDLPQGNCGKFEIRDNITYRGTVNAFIAYTAVHKERRCKETEFFFFQKEMFPNPTMAKRIPHEVASMFRLEQKMFSHRNTRTNPCTSITEHAKCHENCYEYMITNKTTCWLPFIKYKFSNECSTPPDAIKSRQIALDVYQNVKPEKQCGCIKPCEWIYFNGEMELPQKSVGGTTMFLIYYPENFIEHMIEMEAYTFIKMICDVGGNLGLYLGLSLLSIADALQALIDSTERIVARKKN